MKVYTNYYRAKDLKGRWVTGYYACLPYTIYCFKEDYDANPGNDKHYLITTEMMDWGLPNRVVFQEIDPNTLCRCIGTDKNGKEIFELDKVKGQPHCGYITDPVEMVIYAHEWDNYGNTVKHKEWWVDLSETEYCGSVLEDE